MKFLYSLSLLLLFTFASFAQYPIYINYETNIEATGEEGEMMAMMMVGSSMELAMSNERTWVRAKTGTMMTMISEFDNKANLITIFMTGMIGELAFQGSPDEINEGEDENTDTQIELVDETKIILGYKCKKAILTDANGNKSIFWYSEKFKHPENISQMPNEIPGLCLQMEFTEQNGVSLRYTAVEVIENADMEQYELIIPDHIEIGSFEDMQSKGMTGM